jgi:PPOX class probable F420-dependent enzyme
VLTDAVRAFLHAAPLAHLVTLDPDGAPHVSAAWVDLDDGDRLLIGTLFDQHKLANMRRDPRVAVSFEGTELEGPGLRRYLVVRGTAEVRPGGAPQLLHDLAQRYIGPGTAFPPMPDPPPGFVTRITPTRVSGVGPWQSSDGD